ncbi:MAG: transcription antitermination factor NusB [Halothermotrichaceae bacterium]
MKKPTRHQQRIWALQLLYSLDINSELNKTTAQTKIRTLKKNEDLEDRKYYFETLIYRVLDKLEEYNQIIDEKAIKWSIQRMPYVDRNILRIAICEIKYEIPTGVAINEAVELAKEFADAKSASFINGILAKIE